MSQISSLVQDAELIKLHFENMFVKWGSNTPPRTGLHASSLLVAQAEWCVREHVLAEIYPEAAHKPELQPWDWRREAIFENGWDLHKRWQKVFMLCGKVVYGNTFNVQGENVTVAPELDLTHYDPDRGLFFSPDAILEFAGTRYVVEIKGVKQESYVELTDDLDVAMERCETVHKAVFQANLYMHLLELKRAIILVENKNTQEFKVWVTTYSNTLAMPSMQRTYDVKGALILNRLDSHKLPLRICQKPSDARARRCPMRECCFEGMKSDE